MSDRAGLAPLFTWRSAICESDLPPTARHVAATLSFYMNERGGSAYPGAVRLAHDTGLSERTVRSALALLVERGWLVLAKEGGRKGERRQANEYVAAVPPLQQMQGSPDATHAAPAGVPLQLTTPTPAAVAGQLSKELSKNSGAPASPTPRPRDDLWDALLGACGVKPDDVTNSMRGAYGKAVSELRAVGATPEEVRARARRYRSEWPNATLTPNALARHWGRFAGTTVPASHDSDGVVHMPGTGRMPLVRAQ